jgi:hypothetical protein
MLDRYKCGKKIVAGGPAARHRVALTVEADTTGQVDDLISSLRPGQLQKHESHLSSDKCRQLVQRVHDRLTNRP